MVIFSKCCNVTQTFGHEVLLHGFMEVTVAYFTWAVGQPVNLAMGG